MGKRSLTSLVEEFLALALVSLLVFACAWLYPGWVVYRLAKGKRPLGFGEMLNQVLFALCEE